ncbi:MAG: sensor histidine kinase [Actinomycetota bacterium]
MIERGEDSGAALGQLSVPSLSEEPWKKLQGLSLEQNASELAEAVWPAPDGSSQRDAEGARWTWIHLERSLAGIESRIEHQTTSLLLAARDDERRRLARDLHDGLQQDLVVLRMRLNLLNEKGDADSFPLQIWDELARDVDRMIGRLRDLSNAVFPPALIDRGLTAALRSYLVQIPLSVELANYPDPLPRLSSETEASVYFLVLEAVTNALKHADASHLEISVRLGSDGLEVRVADDGRGFELSLERGGRGLKNMAERVEGLGGYLRLSSELDVGTEAWAFIPIGREMDSQAFNGHALPRTSRTNGDRHEKGRRLRESQSRWKEAFARFEQELETSRTNGDHPEEGQVQ